MKAEEISKEEVECFKSPEPKNQIDWKRLNISWWSDWEFIGEIKKYNWVYAEMVLIRFHWERAFYKDTFEVNFALLGFNLCVEWYLGELEKENDDQAKD